jgi:hypothetical protein
VAEPPDVALVGPEAPGEEVATQETRVRGGTLEATVTLPAVPGPYRLATTLHDREGLAYDPATQALVPALIVRVAGTLSVAYGTSGDAMVEVGRTIALPVRVANTGSVAWADEPPPTDAAGPRDTVPTPWLIGRWLRLDGLEPTSTSPATASAFVAPGDSAVVRLPITAPPEPGTYLLVLDVITPRAGSLAALGGSPGLVRVVVVAARPQPGLERS